MIVILSLIAAIACFVVMLRSGTTTEVSPHDRQVFEDRYVSRGMKVLAIRRIGTVWRSGFGQHPPIRQYVIDTEGPGGEQETRIRGISRGGQEGDLLWRFDNRGGVERLY